MSPDSQQLQYDLPEENAEQTYNLNLKSKHITRKKSKNQLIKSARLAVALPPYEEHPLI